MARKDSRKRLKFKPLGAKLSPLSVGGKAVDVSPELAIISANIRFRLTQLGVTSRSLTLLCNLIDDGECLDVDVVALGRWARDKLRTTIAMLFIPEAFSRNN